MYKSLTVALCLGALTACNQPIERAELTQNTPTTMATTDQSAAEFYGLKAKTIDGLDFDFSSLRGKRVLIVNTASECGYTPQYEDLQALHEQYGGEDFTILGFPSNDFGEQEPGTLAEIKSFCSANYGVSFQMMEKVSTDPKNGHEVYQWLCNKSLNGVSDAEVGWNFNKFLIDENGQWAAYYPSRVKPLDAKITSFASKK